MTTDPFVRAEVTRRRSRLRQFPAPEGGTPLPSDEDPLWGLALSGGGRFTTTRPTPHTHSNIAVIEKFLPVEITIADTKQGERLIEVSL